MKKFMKSLFLIAIALGSPAFGQAKPNDLAATTKFVTPKPCSTVATANEIVICGRHDDSRYRLPLPDERESADAGPVRGEAPRAGLIDGRPAACGIFAGERRCRNSEAAQFGYGGGRNPISVLGKLATLLVDGNAN